MSSGLCFRLLFPHCGPKPLFDPRYLPRFDSEKEGEGEEGQGEKQEQVQNEKQEQVQNEKQEQVQNEKQEQVQNEKQEQVSNKARRAGVWWQVGKDPHEALFWTMFRAKYGAERYNEVMRLSPAKTMQAEKQRLVAYLSKSDAVLDEEDQVQLSVLCMPTHRDKALPTLGLYARAYALSLVVQSNTKPIRYCVPGLGRQVIVWINDRGDVGLEEQEQQEEDANADKEDIRFTIEHPLRPLLPCARYPVATLRAMYQAVFQSPVDKSCKKQDVYDRLCEYLALTI